MNIKTVLAVPAVAFGILPTAWAHHDHTHHNALPYALMTVGVLALCAVGALVYSLIKTERRPRDDT